MMGLTDGKYCADRAHGCEMVQLGAYLAEPSEYGNESWFLPPEKEECIEFFRNQLKFLEGLGVVTCLNLATPKLEWGIMAAESFHRAGGDIVELNAHGSYKPYMDQGKLKAMVRPENREELYEWVKAFTALEVPLIVKFKADYIDDYTKILEKIGEYDTFGVHFNIANEEIKKLDVRFLDLGEISPLLLVSGYVTTQKDINAVWAAGADMIGFARPTRENPRFIKQLTMESTS